MSLAVVDDDLEGAAELLQTVYDFGQIEVVGDDADLGLVGDGLVERLEDRGARLEAHPGKRGGAVGVGRGEVETLGGDRRHQRVDRAVLDIAVDEGLRGDEAAREGDVGDAGIGFARELDRDLLWLAGTELILRIHEHGRDAIFEVADEIGIAWEMHPAEFLDRRFKRRERGRIDIAGRIEEAEPVVQRVILAAAGLLILDREADKVLRRLAILPVHGDERHAFAAMQLQREQRLVVRAFDLEARRSARLRI